MRGRGTDVLALGDRAEVDFYLGHGQNIGRGGHVDEEVCSGGGSAIHPSILPPSNVQSNNIQPSLLENAEL